MPGMRGEIFQGKRAKYSIYLGKKVRMFKMSDKRLRLSTDTLIASVSESGSVTNGRRLYRILNVLYKSEHSPKK